MKRNVLFLLIITLIATNLFAQREINIQVLEELGVEYKTAELQAKERAKKFAEDNNIELRKTLDDGTVIELMDVKDGHPIYYYTHNIGAAQTTRADALWNSPNFTDELTGAGFDKVAIWDEASVRKTHQEFNDSGNSKIIIGDYTSPWSDHATHVAGTIMAGGVDSNAKGMAFKTSLTSYDWNNVEYEMTDAAIQGFLLSNHSWGLMSGWQKEDDEWQWYGDEQIDSNEDYTFGYYSYYAYNWDNICYNAPNFLIVRSAGNERGIGPEYAGTSGYPQVNGGKDGFDCISHQGIAKNVITVGAVKKVPVYSGPESVEMTSFSSWGPADDGRIKPDIVACGYGVYSSISTSDVSYAVYNGTSMAAPNVTGSLVLLQQYYQELYGNPLRSSTIKALAIHTAEECGPYEGPDYMYGWGLLNVEKAANLILRNDAQNTINELILDNRQTYEQTITVAENEPLRATICWIDPPGPVFNPELNLREFVLINDLDLKITDERGNTYYPYKLNPYIPDAPATKDSRNNVDNVEHIYIENPKQGEYKITVTHKNTLQGGSQYFSLITSYSPVLNQNDASLANLTVSEGTLLPVFSPSTTNYTVVVANEIGSISITGTTNNPNATIEGNIEDAQLILGDNHFNIKVTAEDESTTITYSINVVRKDSVYYTIKSSVNGKNGTITPEGSHLYSRGESVTYYMKPDKGYKVDEVLLDGNNIGSDITYLFSNINSDHEIVVSFDMSSSIEKYNEKSVKIYPNPAEDYITIESEEIINEIVIFNSSGKKLFEVNNIKENSYSIELNNYATGIYYLKINGTTKKLIIE